MTELQQGIAIGFAGGVLFSVVVYALWLRKPRAPRLEETVVRVASSGQSSPSVNVDVQELLRDQQQKDQDEAVSLRQNLRLKCMHDDEKVRRALEFERERNPNAGEVELLRAAIYRWERENR